MKKIDKFQQYKDCLNGTNIKDLKEFNVCKILYCDIWNMFGLTAFGMLKRICSQILCKPLSIQKMTDHREDTANIAIEIQIADQRREDNDKIFNNLYEYLRPAKHFKIWKKYKLDIMGLIPRLIRLLKYSKSLKGIRKIEEMYLSSQLVMITDLVVLLENKINWETVHFMLIFQEHDTISSTIIQYAQNKGIKVISPQHGLPLNRHEDIDQLVFEGFLCDYKLLWHEFSKKQFVSADIPESKLFVVGNTKMLGCETEVYDWKKTNVFGVLLDYPLLEGAIEHNKELIKIAKVFSKQTNMKGIIKLHPVDSENVYLDDIQESNLIILNKDNTLDFFEKEIEFALAHITSAIIDLIYDGKYVFIYKTNQYYPIETDPIYMFNSFVQFIDNYTMWQKNFDTYRERYKQIIGLYRVNNAQQLHHDFFERLKSNEKIIENSCT